MAGTRTESRLKKMTLLQAKSTNRIQIYPWISYEDITIAPTPPFVRNAEEHLRRIKELDSREDDILLCSAPKSGTHWIHEIVSMLLSQTTEYNSMGSFLDMVLAVQEIDTINAIQGQRLMHTHLPLRFLPKQHFEKDTYMGGWFNYTKAMTTVVRDKSVNIIQIIYEDLIMDPKPEIRRLAEFLEVPYTDKFINELIEKCKFANLRDHKIDITTTFSSDGSSTLFRTGKIGDWKNWFTVNQNEQFDEIYQKEMVDVDVQFTFAISEDKS